MKLDGVDKVEDAAKTADYKAMVYARKIVQSKPEYKSATAAERSDMLERAMHETMEKRYVCCYPMVHDGNNKHGVNYCELCCSRTRGQDTLSKMAAFRAGEYSLRPGTTGPSTNVPISRFLVSHGYIPDATTRPASRDSIIMSSSTPEFSFNSALVAPLADMDGSSYAIPQVIAKRESSAPVQSNHDHTVDDMTPRRAQSHKHSKSLLSSHSPASDVVSYVGRSITSMTPVTTSSGHEILPSIEKEGHGGELAALRLEVARLHDILKDVMMSNNNRNNADNQKQQYLPLNIVDEGTRVDTLDQRLDQMEAMMHTLHHKSLPNAMKRLESLENVVKNSDSAAEDGCAGKVTKMKEVFESLKELLIRINDLL